MTRLEPADKIESIVGAKRHPEFHLARAVSSEQRVYILHSKECAASGKDLRKCDFSLALDEGIDPDVWKHHQDRPVRIEIHEEFEDLIPWDYTEETTVQDEYRRELEQELAKLKVDQDKKPTEYKAERIARLTERLRTFGAGDGR